MPKIITNHVYKSRAKKLKKAGFLSIDLRRNLSPQNKSRITKAHKKYNRFINDNFIVRHVSKKRAKQLKENGFIVRGGKVILPTDGFDSKQIKIKGNKIQYIGADKSIDIILTSRLDFLPKLKKLSESTLPRGQFVTVRIGESQPFRQAFRSYQLLLRYINDWEPKDPTKNQTQQEQRDDLIDQMAIVKYTGDIQPNAKKKKRKKARRNPRSI